MHNLTPTGQHIVDNLSSRYNLSHDAVMHMLIAVNNGAGTMAQFNCPELGGGGQWMAGGMTMVGDMFNYSLKNTVDNLCSELANALANNTLFTPPSHQDGNNPNGWPSELGQPFSSGGQNNSRYAVFPHRLAVEVDGILSVYDTLDYNISGVSQQQGSSNSLVFNSQYGTLSVTSLPKINYPPSNTGNAVSNNQNFIQPVNPSSPSIQQPVQQLVQQSIQQPNPNMGTQSSVMQPSKTNDDIFQIIEKLANLRDLGALSEDEYQDKKNDLLSRI
ncbi:SHOCT domain-containing protein [Marinagarivorans algicola]|uniref:SHOCT domain-containing protein n=1 Tax=Marinagarivorans algicola TaxID=1513270 RepID=UPI0006B91961|nr:SHOCT domain-containing protein [Marinagarivorans algicola]